MFRGLPNCATPGLNATFLAIGACVTHAQIEDGEIADVTLGLMSFVARGIAYRAVRNRGTIGGSIAHADPAADWLTTTIALDASLRLSGPAGRREIKISDFVRGPLDTAIDESEIITHVLVPRGFQPALAGATRNTPKNSAILPNPWPSRLSILTGASPALCWASEPSVRD